MGQVVYILCGATSLTCAIMLLRGYLRTHARLLLWSTVCFLALAVNNILLFVDLVIFPTQLSLAVVRGATALVGMMVLIYGLIWDVT